MKASYFILLMLSLSSLAAVDTEMMLKTSGRALMGYSHIKSTSKEFTHWVQERTIGDNTEYLILAAPLVMSEFRFKLKDIHTTFYFNHRAHKGGARYIYEF
jgi:hypothetical protein